jgi:transposase-like protein
MIDLSYISQKERVKQGLQCPECYSVMIDRFENRFGGVSEDRFECRECGCTWHRENK